MSNVPEYTVSEISLSIKNSLESRFSRVKIRGEISGLNLASSGHMYFNLKDEQSLLSSIIWRSKVGILEIRPEDGMEVLAIGKISTYTPRSNYNFIIENIKIAGEGALLKIIEDRKKKLATLGLFKESLKKNIPFLPNKIGVITSSTGAVIQDMRKKIRERFPSEILLWSVAVQGRNAEEEIIEAITGFNTMNNKPDVIILARGGGSLEDLMAFNSEEVAIAIYNSKIPLISAIGHETDFTISDLVSDIRASTPTAAADLVVPDKEELKLKINNLSNNKKNYYENFINMRVYRLDNACTKLSEPKKYILNLKKTYMDEFSKIENFFTNYIKSIKNLIKNLNIMHPGNKIINYTKKFEQIIDYLEKSLELYLENKINKIESQNKMLVSCSYEKSLEKGFVIIKTYDNKLIKKIDNLKSEDEILINFSDGYANAKVKKIKKNK